LLNSVYSFVGSIVLKIARAFGEEKQKSAQPNIGSSLTLKVVVPPLLTGLFVVIYRQANPAFKAITDTISINWFSGEWLKFTFLGFLLLFGFFTRLLLTRLPRKTCLAMTSCEENAWAVNGSLNCLPFVQNTSWAGYRLPC
jgi:Na+-driven multidrug efflux pump